ncbi:MAG: HDOD domain-containing protein [Gammaproteobacteria bacterium]|nr:HDOD domain-containing protein [Gammaproteobacteria bacterium]
MGGRGPSLTPAAPAGRDPLVYLTEGRLRRFYPLNHVDAPTLAGIRGSCAPLDLAPGEAMFHAGDTDSVCFLLQGTVIVEQGLTRQITAATEAARMPLSPRLCDAVQAIEPAVYLKVPLAALMPATSPTARRHALDPAVREAEDPIDHQALVATHYAFLNEQLELPLLPDVALRIRRSAEDPNSGVGDIVRLLQQDTSLSAYCVHCANSALYAGALAVSGLREAVMRLGLAVTRQLVLSYTLRRMFRTNHPALRQPLLAAWRHCCEVGAIAYALARVTTGFDPEQALLAGLVHDLGSVTVLQHLRSRSLDAATSACLSRELAGTVGAMVLRRWGFGPEFMVCALESDDWQRDPRPSLDLCDLIVLAHRHAPGATAGQPSLAATPAFRKLPDQRLAPCGRLQSIEDSATKIAEVLYLLRS